MEMYAGAIISAILSSGIASMLAKAYISKSLRDLDKIGEKVSEIKSELSAISVKLGHVEKDRDILLEHDRILAVMENDLYGHGTARKASSSG